MKKYLLSALLIGFLTGCKIYDSQAIVSGKIEKGEVVCHTEGGKTSGFIMNGTGLVSGSGSYDDCKTVLMIIVESSRYHNDNHDGELPVIGTKYVLKSDDKKVTMFDVGDVITLHCSWDKYEDYPEWDNCRLVQD